MFFRLSENDRFIYSYEQKYGSVFVVSVIFEYNKLPLCHNKLQIRHRQFHP